MALDVANHCLKLLRTSPVTNTLDLTGGAPELQPVFRHLVSEARAGGFKGDIIDRCARNGVPSGDSHSRGHDFVFCDDAWAVVMSVDGARTALNPDGAGTHLTRPPAHNLLSSGAI